MDTEALRGLIRQKLRDGRLPVDHIPRVWGGPGAMETCDELVVKQDEFLMEGISLTGGRRPLQLHVLYFGIWDAERRSVA
jgi:hypothetical protein